MRTEDEVRRALEIAIERNDAQAVKELFDGIIRDVVAEALKDVRVELDALIEKHLAEAQRQ